MIENLTYIESSDTYPYQNLAVEEYLLLHCRENECILYLWQNQNTIVIGRNQNAWKECLVSKLEEEGGHLVRRLSGGGAVYHDLGNLNFTFLVRKENYDVERQTQVILNAVRKLGIQAELSGRNDVLADGKKFSGHAYYEQGGHCYHHGTMMVKVNLGELSRYLTVSKEKLQSKGVDSVWARVTNLTEFKPDLTISELKEKLREAFEEVYGGKAAVKTIADLDPKEIAERTARFESWEWKFGKKLDFEYELTNRFDWGQVALQFQIKNGIIEDVAAFSDAIISQPIRELPGYLKGLRYDKNAMCEGLERYRSANPQEEAMINDIRVWIKSIDL
jgi:lipoate-protein ligase A